MRIFITTILTLLSVCNLNAQLQINEIMQSNIDCIMDDLNDFPDSWVELYNPQNAPINLKEYSIGLTDDIKDAYKLPDVLVSPNSFYLVYCDKESINNHTDFRLESSEGGCVYLFHNSTIVDRLENIAKQPEPNIAYGRKAEGSNTWGYLLTPTPGTKNSSEIAIGVLPQITFSTPGFVAKGNVPTTITLSYDKEAPIGTEIYYTTDGSEPTRNSSLYTQPLNIRFSVVIRAKAFCDGYLSPRSTTQSYIFHPRDITLPIISIVSDDKYFKDKSIGILVDGTNPDKKNYQYNWRRPINFELFTSPLTKSVLNQLCETRVQGNASRGCMVKSLAIYANKRFGKKRFKYEFFPDQRPGQTNYKSLALRNAGNDFDYLYMRDAIIQRAMGENVDLDWQAWKPAIFYLNGKYIGMLNIRERSNESNIYTNYDELEDIDMFENWWDKKVGTWDNINAFKAFFQEHGHTWDEYSKWMDLHEYINLMIMNMYFNNQDFPGNNFTLWRPHTEDGRWRFIAKDTDFGLGLYGTSPSVNTIAWMYDNNYDPDHSWANQSDHTRLFRRLMEDTDFAREFIDRSAIYMGDFMNYDRVWPLWEQMYNDIKDEYPSHRALINKWWPNYSNELSSAKNWLKARTDYYYKYLSSYYKLGNPTTLTIQCNKRELIAEDFNIYINNVPLTQNTYNGKFFADRTLRISASPSATTAVTGWNIIKINSNGSTSTNYISGNSHEFKMPECKEIKIIALLAEQTDALAGIKHNEQRNIIGYYDLNGIQQNQLKPGINIIRFDDGTSQKILFK